MRTPNSAIETASTLFYRYNRIRFSGPTGSRKHGNSHLGHGCSRYVNVISRAFAMNSATRWVAKRWAPLQAWHKMLLPPVSARYKRVKPNLAASLLKSCSQTRIKGNAASLNEAFLLSIAIELMEHIYYCRILLVLLLISSFGSGELSLNVHLTDLKPALAYTAPNPLVIFLEKNLNQHVFLVSYPIADVTTFPFLFTPRCIRAKIRSSHRLFPFFRKK